jgi:iron complex transport system ATP-binding protein
VLTVENLQFSYGNGPDILKGVSFSLEDGQTMAILGNNGAGKSTMLKCFNRILPAKCGSVYMDGQDLLQMPGREIAKRMAFVAQHVPGTQMTVHDVVMLGRRPYMRWGFTEEDHRIVHEAMEQLGLTPLRGRFLSQLSGGERQKAILARALAQQPKILLLDEPTSSLDLQNQYQVLEIVRDICHNTGITAIVVIHDLNLALRFCDRFLLLKDGLVYRYGDASILDRTAILDVYGVNAEPVTVNGQRIILVD